MNLDRPDSVAVTGFGVEIPGLVEPQDLLRTGFRVAEGAAFDPVPKLGRKGLLYKDRATRMALCAVSDALKSAGLLPHSPELATTGVIVSSNLGNLDTVCRVVSAVRQTSAENTSPLDLPNASSNVIASSIAIRFGCRAVNLTVCNGSTGGLDALYLGAAAIRAGRAERMLVVGVEPNNEVVAQLMTTSARATFPHGGPGGHMGEGAGCVVLEDPAAARRRAGPLVARVVGWTSSPADDDRAQALILEGLRQSRQLPGLWLVPGAGWPLARGLTRHVLVNWPDRPPAVVDLCDTVGDLYGAHGVVQAVAACLWIGDNPSATALVTAGGSWGDPVASILLTTAACEATT